MKINIETRSKRIINLKIKCKEGLERWSAADLFRAPVLSLVISLSLHENNSNFIFIFLFLLLSHQGIAKLNEKKEKRPDEERKEEFQRKDLLLSNGKIQEEIRLNRRSHTDSRIKL